MSQLMKSDLTESGAGDYVSNKLQDLIISVSVSVCIITYPSNLSSPYTPLLFPSVSANG